MSKKVSAFDKALYLLERGYINQPDEIDVMELVEEIKIKTNKAEPKKITNDLDGLYIDKTKNEH